MTALAVITAALAATTALLAVRCWQLARERDHAQLCELAARRDVARLEASVFTLTNQERS